MKVLNVEREYSCAGDASTYIVTFVTDKGYEVTPILENKDKEFVVKEKRDDSVSAYPYTLITTRGFGKKLFYEYIQDRIKALEEGCPMPYPNKDDYKVIFNPPATILWKNGKKYVSKAHDEEFDEEKGLLMCLAKANGISHLELKRMIKNAKRPEKKEKKNGNDDLQ
jgi:hypothetical protein